MSKKKAPPAKWDGKRYPKCQAYKNTEALCLREREFHQRVIPDKRQKVHKKEHERETNDYHHD
jgi:hypothetical protein